jgi:hypothetical protein
VEFRCDLIKGRSLLEVWLSGNAVQTVEYKTAFAPEQTKRRPADAQNRSKPAESSKTVPVVMNGESKTIFFPWTSKAPQGM